MQEWNYETSPDLDKTIIERLKNFPREPEMFVYAIRSLASLMMRAWLKLYHRFEIIGQENLPLEGSFVLVANHSSHLDTLTLLAALPLKKLHRAFPAAAADYFFTSVPRIALSAILVNALPFDRKIQRRQSLQLCQQLLANPGNILILFPEGTRSLAGEIASFKPGIGLLLAGTKIPVIPCYISGAFSAWPKGKLFPRPRQVRLVVGKQRSFSQLEASKQSALQISEELREAVLAIAPKLNS
jgi:1-acyl-sn-glycerol-3-phosphate acyltransferase